MQRRKPVRKTSARKPRGGDDSAFGAIVQAAMDAIITVDERQHIVMFNAAAERIFRCAASAAIGGPLDRFIPERFRAAHRAHIEHFGRTGATVRRMGGEVALYGLRADGKEFPIEASISHARVGGEEFFTVVLRDISRRVEATEEIERSHLQLRDLYQQMHEVREGERMRIARELHDELAQWLTALKMDVAWIAGRLPAGDDRLPERVERMKQLVDSAVTSVRRIAHNLRPSMLDDLGLVPAIEHLLHEFSERTGLVVELDTQAGEVEFREPLSTAVYRMVQEGLTNVARHARATEVRVAVRVEGGELVVCVRDNGIGIGDVQLKSSKSFGLLGIKERARTLGGAAEIYTARDGGAAVEIRIPVGQYRGTGGRA
ncbi:MAG TPA: PAS domain-containing sensor histidine kinase [Burkholderiales bacterium]|jgi:two-component system sensor kinase